MRTLTTAAAALAVCCIAAAVFGGGAEARRAVVPRPNVVVVMTDDETVRELRFQDHVLSSIADRGATFRNSFVNYPLCCPSRTTFMTGLYASNHHVEDNAPPRGGFDRFERVDSANTLPVWLQDAGYSTAEIGKFLNGYGYSDATLIPPGWSEWYGVSGGVGFYNYQINENGSLVSYREEPSDWIDDVITRRAVEFIDRVAPGRPPYFLYVSYKSPHGGGPHPSGSRCSGGPPEPAPRHFGDFAGERLPRPPNFNEADVSDKPGFVQSLPVLTDDRIAEDQTLYQCELESLAGVDDGVRQIMRALRGTGELANTLIIYTSDNGFFHGEHRIYTGKTKVYEPSIRVPLLMRGPGIPEGVRVRDLVTNADLAPTIVRATGIDADRIMNGRPILSDARQPQRLLGRSLLLEARNYVGIRTERYKYVSYRDGEQELYDLRTDPYELQNLATGLPYGEVQSLLANELSTLRNCRRGNCHRLPKLDTKLHYSRKKSPFGGPCTRGPVRVEFERSDRHLLVAADFTVAGNTARVTTAPFELTIPRSELPVKDHLRLDVRAELLDGRELTLSGKLPSRCV